MFVSQAIHTRLLPIRDDMLTPTGYPPTHTAADMAHRTHSTQPALRYPQGRRQTPRRRADPTQTVYAHPFRRAQTQVRRKGT